MQKRWKSRRWSSLPYRSGVNKQANISRYQVAHIKLVPVRCFRERQRHCNSLSPANNGVGVPKVKRAQYHGLEGIYLIVARHRLWEWCADGALVLMITKWRQGAKAVRRMHQRSSCANGRMHWRSSRTTKAMVKAVRKVHRWYSRTDERMRRRSFCTDDREMKAVAKEVRKMHLWLWNKGSDEGRNKALDLASTQEGWSMTKPPMLESVEHQDEKDRMSQLAWNWCLAHTVPTSMSCTK